MSLVAVLAVVYHGRLQPEPAPAPTPSAPAPQPLPDIDALRANWPGFRGPYGNHFPIDDWRGRDLVFIGGGIGMSALRSPLRRPMAARGRRTASRPV